MMFRTLQYETGRDLGSKDSKDTAGEPSPGGHTGNREDDRQRRIRGGERLPPQSTLATQFGVALSTVREAMQALRLLGLVDVRPGRGTYICQNPQAVLRSQRDTLAKIKKIGIVKLYETRIILERAIVALAVERASTDQIWGIREAFEKARGCVGDHVKFTRHDLDFHLRIAQAVDNELLEQFYRTTQDLLLQQTLTYLGMTDLEESAVKLHQGLVEALETKDLEAAMANVDEWTDFVQQIVIPRRMEKMSIADWGDSTEGAAELAPD